MDKKGDKTGKPAPELADQLNAGNATSLHTRHWDYEFEPSTQRFEDALFADDAALERALEQASKKHREPPQPAAPKHQPTAEKPTTGHSSGIDLSVFLSKNTRAGKFSLSTGDTDTSNTHLAIARTGLNHSIPCMPGPLSDTTATGAASNTLTGTVNAPTAKHFAANQSGADVAEKMTPALLLLSNIKRLWHVAKAQFDEYSGRTLPQRTLPLAFQLPVLKHKKAFDHIINNADIRRLFSYKTTTLLSLLKNTDTGLGNLSKCKLSRASRLKLLNACTPALAGKITAFISTLERKASPPGDGKRLDTMQHALNTLKHLINGYKQVYSACYQLPNYLYAPMRTSINACAFRLIDLLCLEQHLAIAAQRALPTNSLKVINKLINALYLYEPELLDQQQHSLSYGNTASIRQLFLHYQALLCFDMMCLSSTQHNIVYHYIRSNANLLTLEPVNECTQLSENALIISSDSPDTVVIANRLPPDNTATMLIRPGRFFEQIKKDYCECLSLPGNSAAPTHAVFAAFAASESVFVLSVLNRCVHRIENHSTRQHYAIYKAIEDKAYSQMDNAIAYLHYRYAQQISAPDTTKTAHQQTVAKPKAGKNKWLCAMEDENRLYLQTHEVKSDLLLDVGVILLFSRVIDNVEHIVLTHITRMERVQNKKLNLVVEKIGHDAIAVTLQSTAGEQRPAIISRHKNTALLISTVEDNFWTGKTVNVTLPDKSSAIVCIDTLNALSQHHQVLSLL